MVRGERGRLGVDGEERNEEEVVVGGGIRAGVGFGTGR